jgi:hypothetical protein
MDYLKISDATPAPQIPKFFRPGIGPALASPSGANYAPNVTKDAWNKTLEFLNKNLKES